MHKNHSGYSLIEILVVLVLVGLGVTVVATNMNAGLATMTPEQALAQTSHLVLEAKSQALLGMKDENRRTFTLQSALALSGGVTISTLPNSYGKGCNRTISNQSNSLGNQPPQNQQSFCLSGQPFYFDSANSFVFNRFDGKTAQPHALFFSSTKRTLALLISQTGDVTVAEYLPAKDEWHSRTDLQGLYSQQPTTPIKDKY